MRARFKRKSRFQASIVGLVLLGLTSPVWVIPLKLAIALYVAPVPQAIFVLGGEHNRKSFAAQLAHQYPDLEIWVSDYPTNLKFNKRLFRRANIAKERINYDLCAKDTVTNFTCTVKGFLARNLRHVYLLTSDYHMRRATAIATVVFGSRGIVVTPVSVPSKIFKQESYWRTLRDTMRSLVWMMTGYTLESV
jgi:uncharacterized SAM-binding protein YcdF (DUF218 family)